MREPTEAASEAGERHVRPWGSLKYQQFRLLIASGLLGSIGGQMREVINLWVVFQLTGSALQLGILGALRIVPLIVFGLAGGVLADMVDRRKILIFGQGASLVLTGALAVLAITGRIELWHVYAATLANTSATVLDQPARMALVTGVVPRSHLSNAVTMTSSMHQASLLLGPAVGGILISMFDSAAAYFGQHRAVPALARPAHDDG